MKFVYIAIAMLLLARPAAFAQGSGSGEESAGSSDSFQVTRSFEGTVTQVRADDHVLVVEVKEGERHSFHLSDETEITSLKDQTDELRKVSDLKPGQRVKVVFKPSDMYITKLRILN